MLGIAVQPAVRLPVLCFNFPPHLQDFGSASVATQSYPAAAPQGWSSFDAAVAPFAPPPPPFGGIPAFPAASSGGGFAAPGFGALPFGAPLQLEAPPAAGGSSGAGYPKTLKPGPLDWNTFGGSPPEEAPEAGSSNSLISAGGFLLPSGFTPGGQTAPAGWASFDDAAFAAPAPALGAATAPAGGVGFCDGGGFGEGSLRCGRSRRPSDQQCMLPYCRCPCGGSCECK